MSDQSQSNPIFLPGLSPPPSTAKGPISSPPVEKRDPWFNDGNIVFVCEGIAVFRVHKSVMAHHSEVFRNMFEDAEVQTTSVGPLVVEGCPALALSDTIDNLQNLLLAFYGQVSLDTQTVEGFLYLSSLLQSASKYCVDWLRKMTIGHLSRSWPTSLQAWKSLSGPPWHVHPALVINLARKVDAHIFLPVALCCLGQLSMTEALETELSTSSGPIAPSAYRLSAEDERHYIRYQEKRRTTEQLFARKYIDTLAPVSNCSDRGFCRDTLKRLGFGIRDAAMELQCSPLAVIDTALKFERTEERLCTQCCAIFSTTIQEKKQKLWEDLPGWFGLPGWDVLSKE